jgi:uncharacterized protein with HEPN domain
MPTTRPEDRLRDILENIDRIERYVGAMTREDFHANELVRDAVERCFARISEAAVKLGETLDTRYPDVPWLHIRRFGNVLRHAYDQIVDDVLWETIRVRLGSLRVACTAELNRLAKP